MMESKDHRDLAKGAIVNAVGIIARSSRSAFLVVIPRLVGAEIFGLYLLAVAIVEVMSRIGGIGLEWGVLREVARLRAQDRELEIIPTVLRVLGLSFVVSSLAAAGFALLSAFLAAAVFAKPELARPLIMLSAAIPPICGTSLLINALRAGRKMQYEVYVKSVAEPAVIFLLGVSGVLMFRRVEVLVVAYVVATAVGWGLALMFFLRFYPHAEQPQKISVGWGRLISYTLPMGSMDALNILKQKLDLMVLGRFLSLELVAVYGVIIELGNLIRKVRQIFEPIFMPIVTYLHEKKEIYRLKRQFALAFRWCGTLGLALVVPMLITPEHFLLVFSKEFIVGAQALSIFAVGVFFYMTLGMSEDVLSMTGHPYINLIHALGLVLLNLSLLLLLIPRFGLSGAAVATSVSFLIVSVSRLFFTYRCEGIHPFAWSQVKPVAAAVAAFILSLLARSRGDDSAIWILAVVVPVFLVSYAAALYFLGYEKEDRDVMNRLQSYFGNMLRLFRARIQT